MGERVARDSQRAGGVVGLVKRMAPGGFGEWVRPARTCLRCRAEERRACLVLGFPGGAKCLSCSEIAGGDNRTLITEADSHSGRGGFQVFAQCPPVLCCNFCLLWSSSAYLLETKGRTRISMRDMSSGTVPALDFKLAWTAALCGSLAMTQSGARTTPRPHYPPSRKWPNPPESLFRMLPELYCW